MEFPETYFQILFNIIRKQNLVLLREIAIREQVPENFMAEWTPSRAKFRAFLKNHLQRQDQNPDHKAVANPSNGHYRVDTSTRPDDSPSYGHD
jgi:hypothetical protein